MRNLWLLLIRNAFTLAFIALMAVSLSVLFRNDGAARSSWFRQTGAISYAIDSQRNGWSNYLKLAEQNAKLAEENADLRSRLLSMDLVASWNEDSVRHWTVRRGMLIKGPDGKPRSPSIATPGRDGGIETGGAFWRCRFWHGRRNRNIPLPDFDFAAQRYLLELSHRPQWPRSFTGMGRCGHGTPPVAGCPTTRSSRTRRFDFHLRL